jgi:hypothetical protein
MMITITLSLAAILVAWAGSSYGAFTSGSQLFFVQRGEALQERFVVENVFFNKTGTNRTIMIFVRNVGVEELNVVALYVNGTSLQPFGSGAWLCTALPQLITVGAVCQFNLQWSTTWATGSIFYIVVASARGNQATYVARGP